MYCFGRQWRQAVATNKIPYKELLQIFINKSFEWTKVQAPSVIRDLVSKYGALSKMIPISLDDKIARTVPPEVMRIWQYKGKEKCRLEIVGDNATVVGWLNGEKGVRGPYRAAIANILDWLNDLYANKIFAPRAAEAPWFTHVYREHNKAADCLATMGILQQQSAVMVDATPNNHPLYVRVQFDGGYRHGVSGSGIRVLSATMMGENMQPEWKTVWCGSFFISNLDDSTSLDAELFGAERAIAMAASLVITGNIKFDNDFNIILPVEVCKHKLFSGITPGGSRTSFARM